MTATAPFERLLGLQMILVTGKGGVGKSIVTAALGTLLADAGRRVLLVEVDPRENLHQLLDVPPSGGDPVAVTHRLQLQHLEPRRALDDLVAERLKVGPLVRRVLDSPVHQHFAEGAPGLKETALFGRVLRLLEGHCPRGTTRPDIVLLDAPATGHGLSLMTAPLLVSSVIGSGPVGAMAAEIATFVHDPERCGVVVVTQAEEMPVEETRELLEQLRSRLDRRPELMVVNGLYPRVDRADERAAATDPPTRLWVERRRINSNELHRLGAIWDGPMVQLPLLPVHRGPALVGALARALEEGLRAAP